METVIAVFPDMPDAERAIRELESNGFARDDFSIVASDRTKAAPAVAPVQELPTGVGAGAGAAIGGVAGAALGLAALAIPGIGPLLAAGPVMSMLAGAGAGAVAGGVIGSLVEWGVPEKEAKAYTEAIKQGGVLVAVHVPQGQANTAIDIMDRNGAVDITKQAETWRTARSAGAGGPDVGTRVETDADLQTGRTRTGGTGARAFIW